MTRLRRSRIALAVALLALAILYIVWFRGDRHLVAAYAVFALPPVLMMLGVLRDSAKAAFWAGVFGLFWFSHGIMVAWSRPGERGYALIAIGLALAIVFAASMPGLRARFAKKPD